MLLNTPITQRRAISLTLAGGAWAAFGVNHLRRGPNIVTVADSDPLAVVGRHDLETVGDPLDRTHLAVELGIPIGADLNEICHEQPRLTQRSRRTPDQPCDSQAEPRPNVHQARVPANQPELPHQSCGPRLATPTQPGA